MNNIIKEITNIIDKNDVDYKGKNLIEILKLDSIPSIKNMEVDELFAILDYIANTKLINILSNPSYDVNFSEFILIFFTKYMSMLPQDIIHISTILLITTVYELYEDSDVEIDDLFYTDFIFLLEMLYIVSRDMFIDVLGDLKHGVDTIISYFDNLEPTIYNKLIYVNKRYVEDVMTENDIATLAAIYLSISVRFDMEN